MKRSLSDLINNSDTKDLVIKNVDTALIKESPTQARKKFDQTKLEELRDSISKNGILQPLIVQKLENNRYELIAGERRLRASKMLKLESVPCLIKDVSKRDAVVLGIVENIQRRKLSSIEEALAYKNLKENFELSNDEIGFLVGKSRPHISNMLRVSNLSSNAQKALHNEDVSFGQIKPIIVLDHSVQDKILEDIISLNLSSRDVEEKVRQLNSAKADEESIHYKKLLEDFLGTKVLFKKNKNKTKISFTLNSKEDLDSFILIFINFHYFVKNIIK
jgi:ParB family chromosome partitioning protein